MTTRPPTAGLIAPSTPTLRDTVNGAVTCASGVEMTSVPPGPSRGVVASVMATCWPTVPNSVATVCTSMAVPDAPTATTLTGLRLESTIDPLASNSSWPNSMKAVDRVWKAIVAGE